MVTARQAPMTTCLSLACSGAGFVCGFCYSRWPGNFFEVAALIRFGVRGHSSSTSVGSPILTLVLDVLLVRMSCIHEAQCSFAALKLPGQFPDAFLVGLVCHRERYQKCSLGKIAMLHPHEIERRLRQKCFYQVLHSSWAILICIKPESTISYK